MRYNNSQGVALGGADLENTNSTFYQSQCGNYNATTNPNGFISGSNLLADTTRHESGTVNAHYENYVVAQNNRLASR
jgi:hypothetical protein